MAWVKAGCLIQEARVLLDSGAAVSLVTSRLANSLKAKRIKDKPLLIQGANAKRRHEDVVELELSPVYTGLNRSLSIQADVMDILTSLYNPCQKFQPNPSCRVFSWQIPTTSLEIALEYYLHSNILS